MRGPGAGLKRSRALWERAFPRPDEAPPQSSWWWLLSHMPSFLRALLYEIQPIRYSELVRWWESYELEGRLALSTKLIRRSCLEHLPMAITSVASFVHTNMTLSHALWLVGIAVYYGMIRWIHELVEAGPLVLLLTAMGAIVTFGLGDDEEGSLSAYTVFNRGFQRLLGTADANDVLAQHLGGGFLGGGGINMMAPPPPEDEMEDRGARRPQRPPRRQEQQRQQAPPPQQRREQQRQQQPEEGGGEAPNAAAAAAPARRSGKKARRRNYDHREELRRQRQAAAALGLDHVDPAQAARILQQHAAAFEDGDDDDVDLDEEVARQVQQLLLDEARQADAERIE